jgi:sugar phosphate isomerase/epimerase
VWFADDPAQTPWHRFLDELAEAGYRWLELGPYGYLPADPARLRDEVDRRGLAVSGQAVFGALHDPDRWDDDLRDARQVAELVTAPMAVTSSATWWASARSCSHRPGSCRAPNTAWPETRSPRRPTSSRSRAGSVGR